MKQYIKFLFVGSLAVLASCEPEFETPVTEAGFYTSGEADFTTYVSVGNSLTSGYADGALYITGQNYSFPNILAQQMAKAGGGTFSQPLMSDNTGGLLFNNVQIAPNRFVLAIDGQGNPGPVVLEATPTTEVTTSQTGPFNNMGVPGAKSFHLVAPGYGNPNGILLDASNPYFARFATSENATVLEDAISLNPTFFTLWIGNNDVLSFATSGGVGINQTGNLDPSTYGENDLTDPNVFASVLNDQVNALTANGAKGVLLNIPDVTSIPFFTTVPFAPLSPLDPDFGPQIPTLNATYAQLNQAFAFLGVPERAIVFSETAASAVVIKDEDLIDISAALTQVLIQGGLDAPTATIYGLQYGQARQATAADLILLTSSTEIGQVNTGRVEALVALGVPQATATQLAVNGITYPMEDALVLTQTESAMVKNLTAAYNITIAGLAAANGLAFVDANAALAEVAAAGVGIDGGLLTSEYVTGGAFSLDGVHPTPQGYAYTANLVIEAINNTYGATIPKVAVGSYPTITLHNN